MTTKKRRRSIMKKKHERLVKAPFVDREFFEGLVDRLSAENPGKTRDECYLMACYILHYPGKIEPGNIEVH